MTREASLLALGLFLVACEGGEIAIFSVNQAGASGQAGTSGTSAAAGGMSAGTAGAVAGESPGGNAGTVNAELGGGGSGGSAGTGDPPCQSNLDCDGGYFCSKQRCDDVQGSCMLGAFPIDTLDQQVCGCDGITYWNDSYRRWLGIAASTMGPCNSEPRTCFHSHDCGPTPDYSCEHFLPPSAACGSPQTRGRCWLTPRQCPVGDDLQYQVCSPPGNSGGGPPPCVTKCEAIQSGLPFTQLSHDQMCP